MAATRASRRDGPNPQRMRHASYRSRLGEGSAHEGKWAFDAEGQIEVELVGGHRLRVSGSYDPEALARLIRGLSG